MNLLNWSSLTSTPNGEEEEEEERKGTREGRKGREERYKYNVTSDSFLHNTHTCTLYTL